MSPLSLYATLLSPFDELPLVCVGVTGNFEVAVDGTIVHSKQNGDGFLHSNPVQLHLCLDWTYSDFVLGVIREGGVINSEGPGGLGLPNQPESDAMRWCCV